MFNKFFKWLWKKIKDLAKTITSRTFWFISFILIWAVPIYLLGNQIAFTQTVTTAWKFTFAGLIVIAFCAIKFYGKIKEKINSIQPKTNGGLILQLILIFTQRTITYAVWFFILKYLTLFSGELYKWYAISLIFIGIGVLFYLADKIVVYVKMKKQAEIDRELLKEEIKGEIANGK